MLMKEFDDSYKIMLNDKIDHDEILKYRVFNEFLKNKK